GGLHIYAHYPQLQIGPVAFVVAQVLRQFGPHQGVFVTEALLTALGLYVLHELTRIALLVRPDLAWRPIPLRVTVLAGGAAFFAARTRPAASVPPPPPRPPPPPACIWSCSRCGPPSGNVGYSRACSSGWRPTPSRGRWSSCPSCSRCRSSPGDARPPWR